MVFKNRRLYTRYKISCIHWLLLFCSYAPVGSAAQSAGIKYVHFTRSNVLATNQVNFVLQDSKKFIWLATSNGIQRFDGNRWLWLGQQKKSTTSLPDNDVTSMLEDSRNRLWVRTSTGIYILDRNSLEFSRIAIAWLPIHPEHDFQSLVALADGHIWLTLSSGGLYCYEEGTKQFISAEKIIPSSGRLIYQIAYDSVRRQYYLGTDAGILIYDRDKEKIYQSGSNPQKLSLFKAAPARSGISTLYLNGLGQLWFSGYNVHSCYDIRKDSVIFCDSISKIWGVLGYTTDRSGTTWSYGAGIAKMNLSSGKTEPIEQNKDPLYGISFQNGSCLMEDSENTYWLATSNGVFLYNRFQQQFFQHDIKSYGTGEVFNHINVWGFIELADSSIVALTTRGEGLYYFDKNLRQLPSKYNLAPFASARGRINIRCGLRDRENHLWVACERGPMIKIYPETGRVEKINDTSFAGLGIYSMTQDDAGNIYIGTFRGAVIRRDVITGKFSTVVQAPENTNSFDNIYCLSYDGNEFIWAASSRTGLLKINARLGTIEKTYTSLPGDDASLPGPTIYSVTKSSFNQLMMATPAGIVVMDIARESFRLLNTADGLPDNNVSALVKGADRNIWVASDNGISAIKLEGMNTTSYGTLEGLTNESFNVGACIQLHDGRLLFGHNEGFTSLNPAAFSKRASPSGVQITGIRLFDKYLNTDSILNSKGGMVLQYNQNFLTIEFSDMSLLNKDHSSYYYRLEGVDKEWIHSGGLPQAVYTYLPGGTYTFRVKCSSGNGSSPEKITAFRIKIIPPLWKAWWFYFIAAVIVCGLVFLFFHTQYKQRFEAEKGRNRIAKDLHDDMGSSLSTITILSEMAKTKIDSDIPTTKRFIHQISDNSNRIMESLDDIVWNIDTANDTMENTLSRMREFAGNLLEARDMSYSIKEDERIKYIHLDLGRRHDFFMIFKEAVINLAKYSYCKSVKIEMTLQKNTLRLIIADDGKGFDQQTQIEGNGLSNMRQRAASLKGVFTVETETDKGTIIILSIPV